jgi:quercetin dioxygenase-like cupin family protein
MPHPAHHHGEEEIVLIKDGQLDVTISGRTQTAGAGSIVLLASNDEHGWRNSGMTAATYYVLRLRTERTP